MERPSIYEEFEHKGHWWIPGQEENQIPGTLSFSKEGIQLELLGTFTGKSAWEVDAAKHYKFPIILGTCEDELITLVDGFEHSTRTKFITSTKMAFNTLIVGRHFQKPEDIIFKSLNVYFTHLELWLKYHPFKNNTNGFGTELKDVDTFDIYINSLKTKIKSNYTIAQKGEIYHKQELVYKPYIIVEPDEIQHLKWYDNFLFNLRDLFMVLVDSPVYIETMEHLDDEYMKVNIYHIPFRNYEKVKLDRLNRLMVDLPILANDLGNVINKWFLSRVKSSHQLYIKNILANKNLLLEDAFLNFAKALESFHRDFFDEDGKYVSEQIYSEITSKMLDSVKEDITSELMSKLVSTLKYANEYGFQRRTKELLKMLPDELRDLVLLGKSIKDFADQVRKNRDYNTHFGDKSDLIYSWKQLIYVNQSLKATILYLILMDLEITPDIIVRAIFGDWNLVNGLKFAKDQF